MSTLNNSAHSAARRLIVFHDSPLFGGHERAFLTWLPQLLASEQLASVSVSFFAGNHALASALASFAVHPKLQLLPAAFHKRRAEPYLAPLRLAYRAHAQQVARNTGADLVLLLQGRIENLLSPLLALAPRYETVSYLPMAHSLDELGSRWNVAKLGDRLRRAYYALPRRYIVPSQAGAEQLGRVGARGAIHVVKNTVPALPTPDRAAARATLGLDRDARIGLFMGRFDPHQKGLDRLVAALEAARSQLGGWQLLFVGEGPAQRALEAACTRLGPALRARVLPWTQRPDLLLSAADVLFMPSRFEGVPLLLLEALQRGLPVLASDIDVFREYLPVTQRITFAADGSLARELAQITQPRALAEYRSHAATIDVTNVAASQRRFELALLGLPDPAFVAPAATNAPSSRSMRAC